MPRQVPAMLRCTLLIYCISGNCRGNLSAAA